MAENKGGSSKVHLLHEAVARAEAQLAELQKQGPSQRRRVLPGEGEDQDRKARREAYLATLPSRDEYEPGRSGIAAKIRADVGVPEPTGLDAFKTLEESRRHSTHTEDKPTFDSKPNFTPRQLGHPIVPKRVAPVAPKEWARGVDSDTSSAFPSVIDELKSEIGEHARTREPAIELEPGRSGKPRSEWFPRVEQPIDESQDQNKKDATPEEMEEYKAWLGKNPTEEEEEVTLEKDLLPYLSANGLDISDLSQAELEKITENQDLVLEHIREWKRGGMIPATRSQRSEGQGNTPWRERNGLIDEAVTDPGSSMVGIEGAPEEEAPGRQIGEQGHSSFGANPLKLLQQRMEVAPHTAVRNAKLSIPEIRAKVEAERAKSKSEFKTAVKPKAHPGTVEAEVIRRAVATGKPPAGNAMGAIAKSLAPGNRAGGGGRALEAAHPGMTARRPHSTGKDFKGTLGFHATEPPTELLPGGAFEEAPPRKIAQMRNDLTPASGAKTFPGRGAPAETHAAVDYFGDKQARSGSKPIHHLKVGETNKKSNPEEMRKEAERKRKARAAKRDS